MDSCKHDSDASDRKTLSDIAEHGWAGIIIDPDDRGPGFEFTVGLMHTENHPEIIVFGLPRQVGHDVLWTIVRAIREGKTFQAPGLYQDVFENVSCRSQRVHESQHRDYLGYAMWHRRHVSQPGTLEAVQCVWPDQAGHFPDDPACDSDIVNLQPDLSRPLTNPNAWLYTD